jgi:predicted PurR-regulated permease PerM
MKRLSGHQFFPVAAEPIAPGCVRVGQVLNCAPGDVRFMTGQHSAVQPNSAANILTAVLLSGAAIYYLQGIIAPLLLAVFLLLLVVDLSRLFERIVPSGIALGMSVLVIVAGFALISLIITDNLTGLLARAGEYTQRMDVILMETSRTFGMRLAPNFESLLRSIQTAEMAGAMLNWLQGGISALMFVLIYLGFLIVSRASYSRKLHALRPKGEGAVDVDQILDRIQKAVQSYIRIQTITGLMIAGASWLVMVLIGLPQALFWAFLIFVASYVPIVGGAVAILLPAAFSLLVFGDFGKPLILLSTLSVIGFVVGNIIQPRMQGVDLNLDPVVVLLSLAFWSILLGATGAFLSTPLTVAAMAILAEFRSTRWLAIVLSSDGNPYPTRKRTIVRRTKVPR